MDSNYLDYGVPISFGWTAQYLDRKTQTRRQWKDSHAAKFLRAYDRAAAAGQLLRVPAIDKGYHAGGKQIGWCVIRSKPYKQRLGDMPQSDLLAEGGMCAAVADFIAQYFKGNADLEVWVIDFEFVALDEELALDLDAIPQSSGVDVDFIDRQLSQIASDGDSPRWRLASHLKMFEALSADGTLTDVQRQAVDNFAIGWQIPEHKCESCDTSDDNAPKVVQSCCIPQQPKPTNRLFEPDPLYDYSNIKYDRQLVIERYLRLLNSPTYHEPLIDCDTETTKPPLKDLPLPPNLIIGSRKILPAVKKKILEAWAIHAHHLPIKEPMDVRTLFYETKLFGYRYNYKSQSWEYG